MTPPTTKGRLARARNMANDLAVSFRKLPDETRDFVRDECAAGEHCTCLLLAASLCLDGMPATWPRTKGRRP